MLALTLTSPELLLSRIFPSLLKWISIAEPAWIALKFETVILTIFWNYWELLLVFIVFEVLFRLFKLIKSSS